MKFQVGDKFVDPRQFHLVTNDYHWGKTLYVHTVAQANKNYFTYNNSLDITGFIAGMNTYCVGVQESGDMMNGEGRFLHLVHDKAEIEKKLNMYFDLGLERAETEHEKEIQKLTGQIEALKEKLEGMKLNNEKKAFIEMVKSRVKEFFNL